MCDPQSVRQRANLLGRRERCGKHKVPVFSLGRRRLGLHHACLAATD